MTPFAAIDFETAGYDPTSACSLGIVAANEDGSVTEWHRLIRPPVMRFAPGCIAIHGIRPEIPFLFGCTARLARHVWAGLPRHKLDVVAGALGFSFRHHDALEDARACAFIVRKALERSGTDDIEAMMKTQRQRLHIFRVHRTKQDYGLCGELL